LLARGEQAQHSEQVNGFFHNPESYLATIRSPHHNEGSSSSNLPCSNSGRGWLNLVLDLKALSQSAARK
jgi:hypothetical protein